jgi:hypothetical protein
MIHYTTRGCRYHDGKDAGNRRAAPAQRASGYIHLKLIPGASFEYIERAVELADRVSLNLEAPNQVRLTNLAPDMVCAMVFHSPRIRGFSYKRYWSVSLENPCVIRINFNRIRCYTPTCTATISGDTIHQRVTHTVGHLIDCINEYRVQWQHLVLAWPRPMVLRYRSSRAVPRPESHFRSSDVWLGNDPGSCSDRQKRVEDFLVSQRWPLHCAHQSECPNSRTSWGRRPSDYTTRSSLLNE